MTDRYANQTTGTRIRDYLQIGTRKARLRETLRLSAAVCQQKLSVEDAYKHHGLKLDDVLRYLTMRGYLRSPTPETTEPQEVKEPAAVSPTRVRVDETV
jgi:hypothetical protein